jgi:hypothetical protein
MTAKLEKLLITRRRVEFFVLRERYGFTGYCRECSTERQFVSVEDAMNTSAMTMRALVGLVEDGELHFAESEKGLLMLCQHSVAGLNPHEHRPS